MAIGAAAGVLGLCLVGGAVRARGAEPELVGLFADGLISFVVDLMCRGLTLTSRGTMSGSVNIVKGLGIGSVSKLFSR